MDTALRALGADPRAFRALFLAHLKMDFRRSSPVGRAIRQREVSLRVRMGISFLVYVLMSLPLALTALSVRDPRTYATLVAGYVMTMVGMMLVMEFGVSVLQSEDGSVLAARPVSASTYTLAKLANLAVFVGFYAVGVSGLPLAFAHRAGEAGAGFALRLALAAAAGSAALGGLLAAGYGILLRRASREKARDLLTWLTIFFSMLIPAGYLLASRWMSRNGLTLLLPLDTRPWMEWLPPVWMAGAVDFAGGERDAVTLRLAVRALVFLLTGALAWSLLRRWAFSLGAEQVERRKEARGGRSPSLAWMRPAFGSGAEWGVFRLLLAYLRRDRATKARIYPQFAMSVAFALIALAQGGLPDPWAGEGAGDLLPFALAGYTALTCSWVPLLLRFSEQSGAAWAFAVAPSATLADMSRGLHRAVLIALWLPCLILTWTFHALVWQSPFHAALVCLPPFLGAAALMELALIWRRPVPLSCRYVKGETGTRMALTFTLMAAFGVLWEVQQASAGSLPFTLVLIGAELTALFALDWILVRALSGRPVVLAHLGE